MPWAATSSAGEHELQAIEEGGRALVVWDPRRGPGEYFLLENRWAPGSYDAGAGVHGHGLPQSGLAVWHVVEDPQRYARLTPPTGGPHEWGRRGLRLLRRNGGTPFDDRAALFDRAGARLADEGGAAQPRWSDGARSGFALQLLDDAGPRVRVRVEVRPASPAPR